MNGIHRVFPNEATVGKEDLEEMGTAMTLDLLEDGVLMLANADTEMVFERPGSVAAVTDRMKKRVSKQPPAQQHR